MSVLGTTGLIRMHVTLLDPLMHSSGTEGNTSMWRVQYMTAPDGSEVAVPFYSAGAISHWIREHGVMAGLDAMDLPEGFKESKPFWDLLMSGGSLSKGGSAIDLKKLRYISSMFPLLGLLGFSRGNSMVTSRLQVSDLNFACEENIFRAPMEYRNHPQSMQRAGSLQGESFLTRHDCARSSIVQQLLLPESADAEVLRLDKRADAKNAKEAKGDSLQMISNFQFVKAGTVGWADLHLKNVTNMELAALALAIEHGTIEGETDAEGQHTRIVRWGAKGSRGFGRVRVRFQSFIRELNWAPGVPSMNETEGLVPFRTPAETMADEYRQHMKANRDTILSALREDG